MFLFFFYFDTKLLTIVYIQHNSCLLIYQLCHSPYKKKEMKKRGKRMKKKKRDILIVAVSLVVVLYCMLLLFLTA